MHVRVCCSYVRTCTLENTHIASNNSLVMCTLLQCKGDYCDGGKTCLSDDQLCDGNTDCTDGFDENWCGQVKLSF